MMPSPGEVVWACTCGGAPILVLFHERRKVWFGGTDRWLIPIEFIEFIEESIERRSCEGARSEAQQHHPSRGTTLAGRYSLEPPLPARLYCSRVPQTVKLSKLELLKRIHQQREFNLQGPSVVHLFATNRVWPCTAKCDDTATLRVT